MNSTAIQDDIGGGAGRAGGAGPGGGPRAAAAPPPLALLVVAHGGPEQVTMRGSWQALEFHLERRLNSLRLDKSPERIYSQSAERSLYMKSLIPRLRDPVSGRGASQRNLGVKLLLNTEFVNINQG